jgi:hypothetical protein
LPTSIPQGAMHDRKSESGYFYATFRRDNDISILERVLKNGTNRTSHARGLLLR